MSVFADILRAAVEATPGAIGGAFAAADGETVDHYSTWDRTDWALLTAHYGIVLRHVQSALNTFHYGEARAIHMAHPRMDIVMQTVAEGYFALLALDPPAPLARAFGALAGAADALRKEMI